MDQVVPVVGNHLAIGYHQDFDETLLRDGTASPSPTDALLFIYKRKRTERNKQDDKASLTHNHSSTTHIYTREREKESAMYCTKNKERRRVSTMRTKRLITSCWFSLVRWLAITNCASTDNSLFLLFLFSLLAQQQTCQGPKVCFMSGLLSGDPEVESRLHKSKHLSSRQGRLLHQTNL